MELQVDMHMLCVSKEMNMLNPVMLLMPFTLLLLEGKENMFYKFYGKETND